MKQILLILLTAISINIFAQSTSWNEFKLKEHWENNSPDEIEGIYIRSRKIINCNNYGNCKTYYFTSEAIFFIVKQNNTYVLSSFDEDVYVYGTIQKVYGVEKYFLSTNLKYWIDDKNEEQTYSMYLSNSNELVLQDILDNNEYGNVTISDKFSPIYKPEKKQEIVQKQKFSGTGFGISSNGIIVTNFHVIDGAKTIKVRGINSDFNKTYNAKVLVSDKNNDLAIIQIDDYGFTSLGIIPYTIKLSIAGVGENIFVLGYPLRATMGDEIKLTNGIVSSRTGFQGDITSYQISAPVQPGNSGGPLFDSQGNLIGIINAKHGGAENVSYAVKTSYLTNLIELLTNPPKLQTVNSLSGKTLTKQVELAKKFIYIIETE